MNILVDLFRCFCLCVFAVSFKIKDTNYRFSDKQRPVVEWRRKDYDASTEGPWRNSEGQSSSSSSSYDDDNYSYDADEYDSYMDDYESAEEQDGSSFHNSTVGKGYGYDRDDSIPIFLPKKNRVSEPQQRPYAISDRPNEQFRLTHKLDPELIEQNPYTAQIKQYHYPGARERYESNMNALMCIADCKMVDLMAFNMRSISNGSVAQAWYNKPIAGRPYTFATLAEWCVKNCGSRTGWSYPVKDMYTRGMEPKFGKRGPYEDKPGGVYTPVTPVLPTIIFPPIAIPQNFFAYPAISAPFLYNHKEQRRHDGFGMPFAGPAYPVPPPVMQNVPLHFRSIHEPVKNLRKVTYFERRSSRPIDSPEEYDDSTNDRSFFMSQEKDSEASRKEDEVQLHVPESHKTFMDKVRGSKRPILKEELQLDDSEYDEMLPDEEDLDDSYERDQQEEETDGTILQFLRQVSKILSNKGFQILLKSVSSCEDKHDIHELFHAHNKSNSSGIRRKEKNLKFLRTPKDSGNAKKSYDAGGKEKVP